MFWNGFMQKLEKKKVMGARIRNVSWLLYDLDSPGISRQKELTLYKTRNSPRRMKYFLAKCVDLKWQGLAKVEHKPAILENGPRKLYECGG